MMSNEKQACIDALHKLLNEQIQTLQNELDEVIASRNNESKSSVGDKYETGRAMMQLRQEQIEIQLTEQKKNLTLAKNIFDKNKGKMVSEGSLVKTNHDTYLIGLGLGPIREGSLCFYSISLASPFGQAIRDKTINEQFDFRGRNYKILEVS